MNMRRETRADDRGFSTYSPRALAWIASALLVCACGESKAKPTQSAKAACEPPAESYGAAPAGWTYRAARPEERQMMLERLELADEPAMDVSYALNGTKELLLLGIPEGGKSAMDGAEHGARKAGATITPASYGDATVLDYSEDVQRTVVGLKGCNAVFVMGAGDAEVDTVARAVFG